ncbi:ribonuclease H-like domain, reverse transcriptase, RNA-dependent DNA polymerase, partial [Tanacetum coccineum]
SGCSRHITGNKCYLTEYEDYDGGFVSCGDGKGIISGKRTPLIDFMKPFECPVSILNTKDHLGKFDGKADEGFFVGYFVVTKAMRVFNKRTRIVEETLNIRFLEIVPNVTRNRPDWLFDVDSLSKSMNYVPIIEENRTNGNAGKRDYIVADPKVNEEDAKEKPTEMDESGASDKDGKDDQATRNEEDASKQGRNSDKTKPMFKDSDFDVLDDAMKNVDATPVTPPTSTTVFDDDEDLTIAQNLNGRLMVYKCSGLYTSAIWIKVGSMVSYLEKTEENADFHQILDFLTSSSINFALTAVVVSESSVKIDLHLNDEDGTACLTTNEIFENLALIGYEPAFDKLTFYKGLFSSQWKYLIHTILHCLSSKSTSWDQFSTNLASVIICLAKGQKFNFSKLIFDGMLRNLDSKKFLMYLRKLGKGFSGRVTPLFQNMLVPPVVVGEGSEQPPEPQPTPSTTPPKVLSQSGGSPNKVGDEAINEEMFDSVERAATISSSLKAEQWSLAPRKHGGMQAQTRSEGVSNLSSDPPLSGGHTLGSGEDNMEHQIELTDNVPNMPHDLPLPGVNTSGSDEGSLELNELMDLVTKLSHRVFDLEKVKTAQAKEIAGFKRRVTKLEQRQRSKILKNHPFRFSSSRRQSLGMAIVQERETEVIDTKKSVNTAGEGVSTASVPETVSIVAPRTPPPTTTVFDDEDVTMAMAQTLIKMKEEKAKEKVAFRDMEETPRLIRSITTLQPFPTIDPKDKGKGILQETESVEKTKNKVQGDA